MVSADQTDMTRPAVSVLLPAYNAEATISAALRSILRQSLQDLELVVVDDGSTDGTCGVVRDFARADGRVRVVRTDHGGIIEALNTGLSVCSGRLIARMDADDISHPRRLQSQMELMLACPEVGVCASFVRMFPRRGLLAGLLHYEQWLNSLVTHEEIVRDIFVESPVAHPSVMVRKQQLLEVGGYQDRGWPEDYDLWLRYHERGAIFAKIEETLLWWRQSAGRLTFSDSRYSVENFLRAKAHYIVRRLAGTDRQVVLWGAGRIGKRLMRHLFREKVALSAVVDIDPKKIGRVARGVEIVPREYLLRNKDCFVVAAVGSSGAREQIRSYLEGNGFVESRDFLCAA